MINFAIKGVGEYPLKSPLSLLGNDVSGDEVEIDFWISSNSITINSKPAEIGICIWKELNSGRRVKQILLRLGEDIRYLQQFDSVTYASQATGIDFEDLPDHLSTELSEIARKSVDYWPTCNGKFMTLIDEFIYVYPKGTDRFEGSREIMLLFYLDLDGERIFKALVEDIDQQRFNDYFYGHNG